MFNPSYIFQFNLSLLGQSHCMSQSLDCLCSGNLAFNFFVKVMSDEQDNGHFVCNCSRICASFMNFKISKSLDIFLESFICRYGPRVYSSGGIHFCCTGLNTWHNLFTVSEVDELHTFNKLEYYTFYLSSCQLYFKPLDKFSNLLDLRYPIYDIFVILSSFVHKSAL